MALAPDQIIAEAMFADDRSSDGEAVDPFASARKIGPWGFQWVVVRGDEKSADFAGIYGYPTASETKLNKALDDRELMKKINFVAMTRWQCLRLS